jgi:hypothetical protein
MRKLYGLASAVIALLMFTAIALAGKEVSTSGQTQTLEIKHSTKKSSKKRKGRNVYVTVRLSLRKTDGSKASPTTGVSARLPRGMRLGYRRFPKCKLSRLTEQGIKGCPKRSRIGRGKILADARPVIANPVSGKVTAFNGRKISGKPTYLIYVQPELSSPITIVGKLNRRKRRLDFDVPLVPTLPGQPNATLTYFKIKTGGKIRKTRRRNGRKRRVTYHYLENPRRCRSRRWKWRFDFKYENGERLSPVDRVRCRR